MSLDNFLVRPHRRYVEKYQSAGMPGRRLDADAQHELIEHVAGLPSAIADDDLAAKQFDLSCIAPNWRCCGSTGLPGPADRITEIASLLEELGNVPMVAAEMALISEMQTDEFWQDITLPMLETVRRRLRALVKLIEYKKRPLVYSDFEDHAGAAAEIIVRGISVGTDMDAFRRKARVFLKPYENHSPSSR